MRKDFKTGLLIGSVLCLVGLVWFCLEQRISSFSPGTTPGGAIEKTEPDATVYEPLPATSPTNEPSLLQPSSSQTVSNDKTDIRKPVVHTVKSGQTLSDISKIYYGTTQKWRKIYRANKKKFPKGPDAIKTGIELVIPK